MHTWMSDSQPRCTTRLTLFHNGQISREVCVKDVVKAQGPLRRHHLSSRHAAGHGRGWSGLQGGAVAGRAGASSGRVPPCVEQQSACRACLPGVGPDSALLATCQAQQAPGSIPSNGSGRTNPCLPGASPSSSLLNSSSAGGLYCLCSLTNKVRYIQPLPAGRQPQLLSDGHANGWRRLDHHDLRSGGMASRVVNHQEGDQQDTAVLRCCCQRGTRVPLDWHGIGH